MSDTEKRCDVLDKFLNRPDVFSAMADRIVELEAAVQRVRALHAGRVVSNGLRRVCRECEAPFPCPTLRALEVGRE